MIQRGGEVHNKGSKQSGIENKAEHPSYTALTSGALSQTCAFTAHTVLIHSPVPFWPPW